METRQVKPEWVDKAHPNITQYWNELKTNFDEEYQRSGRDYVKEAFIKIVGDNLYRFIRSYNKRMKIDIDSVPGLQDRIFGPDNDYTISFSDIFFNEDGYKLYNPSIVCGNNDRPFNPVYRREEITKYFTTKSHGYFDKIHECNEFCTVRNFQFDICESDRPRYDHGNPILGELCLYGDRGYVKDFLNKVKITVSNYIDNSGKRNQYLIFYIGGVYFKIIYSEAQVNHNLGRTTFAVPLHTSKNGDYGDLYRLCDQEVRTVHIKSNSPIFSDEACKFFHFMEKLYCYDNGFISVYKENFESNDPTTYWLDELYLKYSFVDNSVIDGIFDYLNTTRDRNFRYNPNDGIPPGKFLKWIYPTSRREVYDRYGSNTTYNMDMIDSFPMWLDLRNRCILENIVNLHDYGQVANEFLDHENNRLERITHAKHVDEMIDCANLKRQQYFESLVQKYVK